MKFGRIPTHLLQATDMGLPPEPADNIKVLQRYPIAAPALYVGCTQWKCKAWVGVIYPPGLKDTILLHHYARHFNALELNAMHYRIFPPETIKKWVEQVAGTDLQFCAKFPQSISHSNGFTEVQQLTDAFLESIAALGNHAGPAFLQVSEALAPHKSHALLAYLQSLATRLPLFVEVRHPQWFEPATAARFSQWLTGKGIGWVITDAPGRRDVCHMHLTTHTAFIRFLGNNLHPTDFTRIDNWINRLYYWFNNGLKQVYFFMHHPEEQGAPQLIDYMLQQWHLKTKLPVLRPQLMASQGYLL